MWPFKRKPPEAPPRRFALCESVAAGSGGRWHIRKLTSVGLKCGGGVDTGSLCGAVRPRYGWDLQREFERDLHSIEPAVCPECFKRYLAQR